MGCGCGKRKKAGANPDLQQVAKTPRQTRPRVVRQLGTSTTAVAPAMPTSTSPRPFSRRRYYIVFLDGTEEMHNTLASAQARVRELGSGHKIESRRE